MLLDHSFWAETGEAQTREVNGHTPLYPTQAQLGQRLALRKKDKLVLNGYVQNGQIISLIWKVE